MWTRFSASLLILSASAAAGVAVAVAPAAAAPDRAAAEERPCMDSATREVVLALASAIEARFGADYADALRAKLAAGRYAAIQDTDQLARALATDLEAIRQDAPDKSCRAVREANAGRGLAPARHVRYCINTLDQWSPV